MIFHMNDAYNLEELRRSSNQAWEMVGLARKDGDKPDEQKWVKTARELDAQIRELTDS